MEGKIDNWVETPLSKNIPRDPLRACVSLAAVASQLLPPLPVGSPGRVARAHTLLLCSQFGRGLSLWLLL